MEQNRGGSNPERRLNRGTAPVPFNAELFKRRLREQYQALRVGTEQMNARVNEMLHMLPVTRAHGLHGPLDRGCKIGLFVQTYL